MNMKKATSEEKLKDQLKNFTIEEIESYLELLLTKCLEALEKEDFSTYNNIEKTLNNSLIMFSSKVRNFSIVYNRIKLRVANKFLKKYLNNSSLTLLEEVGVSGSFLSVEEAEKITAAEEYKRYLKAKASVENNYYPNKVFSNDKYCYLHKEGKLINKETGYTIFIDVAENLEVLKAFITKDSAVLTEAEKTFLNTEVNTENISEVEKKLEKEDSGYHKYRPEENAIKFFNQNAVFTTYINDYEQLMIFHNRTGAAACIELFDVEEWFLIDFCSYCLGKAGITIEEH